MDNYFDLTENKEFVETPQWDLFRGNNHKQIANHNYIRGGGVNFADYIGKPLDYYLWEDLMCRLCITGLRIYRHDEAEWLDGLGQGYCVIHLNEDETVHDIQFYPHHPYFGPKVKYTEILETLEFLLPKETRREPVEIYQAKLNKAKEIYNILYEYVNKKWTIVEKMGVGVINSLAIDAILGKKKDKE